MNPIETGHKLFVCYITFESSLNKSTQAVANTDYIPWCVN